MSDDAQDKDRYPTLSAHGRQMLTMMREHPNAPLFRNRSGNRLSETDVETVRAFEQEVLSAPFDWDMNSLPGWLDGFVDRCFATVPHYRSLGLAPGRFTDVAPISRGDLARDIAAFVPDDVPADRLINFSTTGTTGQPLLVASHPLVAGSYLAFHKRALKRFGIELTSGRGQVGVVLVGFQKRCFTYVSVTPTMDDCGLAKINLHTDDWRDPSDRAKYLDALSPEVYSGDPLSLAELATLPLKTRPRALLSTSMTMTMGWKRRLEEHFGCPVLDLYSLNEAGPIAVGDHEGLAHCLLQPGMYVEILDAEGDALPAGARGELTLTGGFNFCLPLLRYRTGDHASLGMQGETPVLLGLEGRAPVRFRTAAGMWINNIDVTQALRDLPLAQYTLHQRADSGVLFRMQGMGVSERDVVDALQTVLGASQPVTVEQVPGFDGKVLQYRCDFPETEPPL